MNAYIFVGLNNHDKSEIVRNIKIKPKETIDLDMFVKKEINTPDDLINHCSEHFMVSKSVLLGRDKHSEIIKPRQMCIHAIKAFFPLMTLKQIGVLFNRDHSSIIYALNTVNNMFDTNQMWIMDYNKFIRSI